MKYDKVSRVKFQLQFKKIIHFSRVTYRKLLDRAKMTSRKLVTVIGTTRILLSIAKTVTTWVAVSWIDDRACIDHAVVKENTENLRPAGVPVLDRVVRVIRLADDHILEIADENEIFKKYQKRKTEID